MSEIMQFITTIFISLGGIIKVVFRGWHIRKFFEFFKFAKAHFSI